MTLPTLELIYDYSAWKLWLAYGIAILLASAAVVVGTATMWSSGAAYSDNFSTVFRAASGAEVSTPLRSEDLNGRDPLSRELAEATVSLVGARVGAGDVYQRVSREGQARVDDEKGEADVVRAAEVDSESSGRHDYYQAVCTDMYHTSNLSAIDHESD